MRFIKLTATNGSDIWINSDRIESIVSLPTEPIERKKHLDVDNTISTIYLNSRDFFDVTETPMEIFGMLKLIYPTTHFVEKDKK